MHGGKGNNSRLRKGRQGGGRGRGGYNQGGGSSSGSHHQPSARAQPIGQPPFPANQTPAYQPRTQQVVASPQTPPVWVSASPSTPAWGPPSSARAQPLGQPPFPANQTPGYQPRTQQAVASPQTPPVWVSASPSTPAWGPPSSARAQPIGQPPFPANQTPAYQPRTQQAVASPQTPPVWVSASPSTPAWGPPSSSAPAPSHPTVPAEIGSLKISDEPSSSSSQSNEDQIQAMERPGFGTTAMQRIIITANHFHVDFPKDGTIFHYDVDVQINTSASAGTPRPLGKSDRRLIRDRAFTDEELENSVYDGEKNIFSKIVLEGNRSADFRGKSYDVNIQAVKKLELSKLSEYLTGRVPEVPRSTLQGLDLAIKENMMKKALCVGTRIFFTNRDSEDLGKGLVACKGFQPRLMPTQRRLALCLDYSVLPFRRPLPVIDYLKLHLPGFTEEEDVFRRMRKKIADALQGLKVRVTHRVSDRKYTIKGLTSNAADEDYENGFNIVEHFKKTWDKVIAHPKLPCLALGKADNPNDVPLEFCELVQGQKFPEDKKKDKDRRTDLENTMRRLKNLTLATPSVRSGAISATVKAEDGPKSKVVKNFGMKINMDMTRLEARVLGVPQLNVRGEPIVREDFENNRRWDLRRKKFVEPKSLDRWVLLEFCKGEPSLRYSFVPDLRKRCTDLGIRIAEYLFYRIDQMNVLSSVDRVGKLLQNIMNESNRKGKGKLQMIICSMAEKNEGYKYVKWISETRIGVVTQCFLTETANKQGDQYIANLCLKINAKLGGNNFELRNLAHFSPAEHVMFIGADVNHPAPTNNHPAPTNADIPSIVAVVGSMNWPSANRYAARVSPQKGRAETIENFGEMCSHLVDAYTRINNAKPKKIIVFRDGVDEGQFEKVLGKELKSFKNSICTDDYKPLITVIVAQKRHKTRLFCERGNVPPGTVVDEVIVHPRDFDFYLCSHHGLLGTSRPTHYYVLLDENKFTADQLQKMIYDMCFTFVRCTRPVSLVPPVYYADLAAYRGRFYQEAAASAVKGRHASAERVERSFYNLHSDLKDAMFFV